MNKSEAIKLLSSYSTIIKIANSDGNPLKEFNTQLSEAIDLLVAEITTNDEKLKKIYDIEVGE